MSIGIAAQQEQLKKEHAGGPHFRSAAKPRRQKPPKQRLNLKKQKSTEKYSRSKENFGKKVQFPFFHGR